MGIDPPDRTVTAPRPRTLSNASSMISNTGALTSTWTGSPPWSSVTFTSAHLGASFATARCSCRPTFS